MAGKRVCGSVCVCDLIPPPSLLHERWSVRDTGGWRRDDGWKREGKRRDRWSEMKSGRQRRYDDVRYMLVRAGKMM